MQQPLRQPLCRRCRRWRKQSVQMGRKICVCLSICELANAAQMRQIASRTAGPSAKRCGAWCGSELRIVLPWGNTSAVGSEVISAQSDFIQRLLQVVDYILYMLCSYAESHRCWSYVLRCKLIGRHLRMSGCIWMNHKALHICHVCKK